MTKNKGISLYAPPEIRKKLEAEAKQHMRSVNNMLVIILTNYFREKSRTVPVRNGATKNGATVLTEAGHAE